MQVCFFRPFLDLGSVISGSGNLGEKNQRVFNFFPYPWAVMFDVRSDQNRQSNVRASRPTWCVYVCVCVCPPSTISYLTLPTLPATAYLSVHSALPLDPPPPPSNATNRRRFRSWGGKSGKVWMVDGGWAVAGWGREILHEKLGTFFLYCPFFGT